MMLYLILLGILIRTSNAQQLQSPCPNLFTYEPEGVVGDRWYGNIRLVADSDYSGLWIRTVYDREFPELGTDFGEAVKRESDWLIRRPKNQVTQGQIINIRIFARFDTSGPAPQLAGIRLNGRTVCPEDGVIPTTTAAPQEQLISPCPTVFQYEAPGLESDRWYGTIYLKSEKGLSGIWLRIRLDRASIQLGNWFGEVKTEDNKEYLIRNREYKLVAGQIVPLRFFIKYNLAEPVPKLGSLLLNAETICPTEGNTGGSPQTQRPAPTQSTGPLGWVTLPPPNKRPSPNKPVFGSDFDPSSRPSFLNHHQNKPNNYPQCGTVAPYARPLITYGTTTIDGQWPWHAALYYPKGTDLQYICGASLISLNHVLTVAHCVAQEKINSPVQNDDIEVFLGKYHLRKFSNQGIQSFQVRHIVMHPDYNFQTYQNDIAVIHLERPAEFTNWVRPVCLWSDNVDLSAVENREGTVVGWGYDQTGKVTDHLTKANMPVVSHLKCIWSYPEFFGKFATNKTFCAGFRNGTSVCNGDSGGGLVFPKSNSNSNQPIWQIRGLVSISVALQSEYICDTSHYAIFTDVAKYLDWIKRAMNS